MRLSQILEFKATDTDATGLFTGFAATFGGEPDAYGDIIAPGAFTATLAEHKRTSTMPALLWAHDQSEPIGRFVEMKETTAGLEVTGKLTLGTRRGSESYHLMKDAALGLSIGYMVPHGGVEDSGATRLLKQINLFEVSAVAIPANRAARIIAVKSAPQTPRELEALLRDVAGFSSRQAKAVAAKGWPAIHERDVQEDDDDLVQLIKSYTTKFKGI